MENLSGPGPLSPRVDHVEKEEVAVDEKMDEEVTFGDVDVQLEEAQVVNPAVVVKQQQHVNVNGKRPGPSSMQGNHQQQGASQQQEVVELDEAVDEQQESASVAGPSPKTPRIDSKEKEIIDLTLDDDEDFTSTYNSSRMENEGEPKATAYQIVDWSKSRWEYPLFHKSSHFKELAQPFFDLVDEFGEACYNVCRENYNRDPSVGEFAHYCVSKGAPDRNWYGELVFVNPQRRGWPLQYKSAGNIYVEGTGVNTTLLNDTVDWRYVIDNKLVAPDGPNAGDLKLWQFELTEVGPGEREFFILAKCKKVLHTVRKLMDSVWFPSDPDHFLTFYNHVLYDRLVLLYYLEYPSPTAVEITESDRSKIISAIKHFHHLKNTALKVYPSQKDEDKMEDDDLFDQSARDELAIEQYEMERSTVKYQMDIKRHVLEMSFLLSPTIRPLLPFISAIDECDSVHHGEIILVMNETNFGGLKHAHEQMEEYGVKEDANIRIVPDLEMALKRGIAGTAIFVTCGNYNISGLWKLSDGGSIIGLKTATADVTVSPTDAIGNVWLFADGPDDDTLMLKNLSLIVDTSADDQLKTMIHVKSGQFNIQNCVLRDNNPSPKDELVGSIMKSQGANVTVGESCVFTNVKNMSVS